MQEFPAEWYDLATEDHFWAKARLDAFLELARKNPAPFSRLSRGLDIGCGSGLIQCQLARHFPWTIDGVDLHPGCLSLSPPNGGRNFVFDVTDPPGRFAQAYDFLILFDVLEHLPSPVSFLQKLRFFLKEGGILFVNVPALETLRSVYDDIAGHLRRYRDDSLRRDLQAAGWAPVDVRYWGFPLLPLLVLRKILFSLDSKTEVLHRGFAPPSRGLNQLLYRWSRFEAALPFASPLGTSVLAMAQVAP